MNFGSLVAWVADADEPWGRAVALALSSRGARVLVTGKNERAIAECVGEIAHAGGKARHFVGDAGSEAGARACLDATVARFAEVHVAVVGESAAKTALASWPSPLGAPRVVAVSPSQDEASLVTAVLAQLKAFDSNGSPPR